MGREVRLSIVGTQIFKRADGQINAGFGQRGVLPALPEEHRQIRGELGGRLVTGKNSGIAQHAGMRVYHAHHERVGAVKIRFRSQQKPVGLQ